MGSRQRAVGSGQWAVGSPQRALGLVLVGGLRDHRGPKLIRPSRSRRRLQTVPGSPRSHTGTASATDARHGVPQGGDERREPLTSARAASSAGLCPALHRRGQEPPCPLCARRVSVVSPPHAPSVLSACALPALCACPVPALCLRRLPLPARHRASARPCQSQIKSACCPPNLVVRSQAGLPQPLCSSNLGRNCTGRGPPCHWLAALIMLQQLDHSCEPNAAAAWDAERRHATCRCQPPLLLRTTWLAVLALRWLPVC